MRQQTHWMTWSSRKSCSRSTSQRSTTTNSTTNCSAKYWASRPPSSPLVSSGTTSPSRSTTWAFLTKSTSKRYSPPSSSPTLPRKRSFAPLIAFSSWGAPPQRASLSTSISTEKWLQTCSSIDDSISRIWRRKWKTSKSNSSKTQRRSYPSL